MLTLVLTALLAAPASSGLQGLGAPGGLTKAVDPKALAFETDLLTALNAARAKAGVEPVRLDEPLRLFARREAELAARGSPELATTGERIKSRGLAPYGHRIVYGFGTKAPSALAELLKDAELKTHLLGDYQRAGLGAFYVPDDEPYFQLALLLVRDPDPMAGKPGLSPAETDPVMQAALARIKTCYDEALKRNPNLRGDLIVQLVIGATGGVDSVKVLKSMNAPDFEACAGDVLRQQQFPAPYKGKPVTLNQPMRFSPPYGDRKVGRLTASQVAGGFGVASGDFKACYDARAKDNPKLAGTLTLGLTVAADGAVSALDVVHDEIGDRGLVDCVVARAKKLRFAAPEFAAPVELTYPLRFAPGG